MVFVLARLLHSVVYLAGKQPWRTLFFIIGGLATLALIGDIVWLLVQGPAAG
jgi:prostaglandin-E synthase 1